MPEAPKSTFENVNELLKTLAWPAIILIGFLSYRADFNEIIHLIPRKLESSSKFSVGSLSFEIEKTAKVSGNAELGVIIKDLSEEELRRLLTLGKGRYSIMVRGKIPENSREEDAYSIPQDIEVLRALEKHGLIKSDEPIDSFLKFFKELHPTEKKAYRYSDDAMDSASEPSGVEYTDLTIAKSKLTAREIERIDHYDVRLSESGRKAFDIIVKVIAEQINKN